MATIILTPSSPKELLWPGAFHLTVKPLNGNRFPVGLRAGREAAGQIAEHWKVLSSSGMRTRAGGPRVFAFLNQCPVWLFAWIDEGPSPPLPTPVGFRAVLGAGSTTCTSVSLCQALETVCTGACSHMVLVPHSRGIASFLLKRWVFSYLFLFFFSVILDFFFPLMTEESLISFDFSSFCCIFVGLTRRRGDVQLSLSHPLVGKAGLSSAFFPVLLSPREGRIAPLFLLFFFSIYWQFPVLIKRV